MRKKINRIISILLLTVTISMIGAVGLAVLQMGANRGIPTLLNYSFFVIRPDAFSMVPTLPPGTGLVIKKTEDYSTLRAREIDPITGEVIYEGDILTFFMAAAGDRIVTHRLIEIEANPNQPDVYGTQRFITLGDCEGCAVDDPIYEADIIGRVVHVSPTIGLLYRIASNRWVVLVIVVIPLAVLTFSEGRTLLKTWKEKEEDPADADSEKSQPSLVEPTSSNRDHHRSNKEEL